MVTKRIDVLHKGHTVPYKLTDNGFEGDLPLNVVEEIVRNPMKGAIGGYLWREKAVVERDFIQKSKLRTDFKVGDKMKYDGEDVVVAAIDDFAGINIRNDA